VSEVFDNPFALQASEYKRDLDVFNHYIRQVTSYLCIMTGTDEATAIAFIKQHLGRDKEGTPLGLFPFTDPMVKFLERGDNGDRVLKETTLSRYIGESIRNDEIIAPTFTTYLPPSQKQSLLALFIDANVKRRSVAKKEMFRARMDGNKILEILKDNEQTNMKLSNNSCSGAHVSASTPLFNKTAHSTLTSNCRITAGYGSANNEKFLNGNRHYWSPEVVKNSIISIVSNSDYDYIDATMRQFGIREPSVDEVMQCIEYSTNLYWRNPTHMALIRELVVRLTPIQRAAFAYTGDLYHLMRFNQELVHGFIGSLSNAVMPVEGVTEDLMRACVWPRRTDVDFDAHRAIIKGGFEDHIALATQLLPEGMKGLKVSDTMNAEIELALACTIRNIANTVTNYGQLIKAFFVTKNVPSSLAKFPESIRRAALMGDTDSTIFTVQDWVIWYNNGRYGYDARSSGVAATMIFLSAQTVTHLLARMSANLGIEEKRLFQVAMKNEYKFDVFVPTQVAKHYYASIGCQEGNMYSEQKEEIKGVHLKSSNAPRAVMAKAKAMMIEIMDIIMQEKKLSITKYLNEIATLEHDIYDSIMVRQSYEYFRMGQIKTAASYTLPPEKSNYAHYLFWNATFGTKYGEMPEPPWSSVKISVNMDSPTKVKAWLSKMEDRDLAEKIAAWMVQFGKKAITTFHVPEQVIQSIGIPKEILSQVYVRKIQIDTVNVFYILLESLGVYVHTDKSLQLVSDYYEGNKKEQLAA
jgi:hypothetical protein